MVVVGQGSAGIAGSLRALDFDGDGEDVLVIPKHAAGNAPQSRPLCTPIRSALLRSTCLKRIPPLNELESEKHKEELTA
jgi:hypothetical protein